jgi:hypothetical protein
MMMDINTRLALAAVLSAWPVACSCSGQQAGAVFLVNSFCQNRNPHRGSNSRGNSSGLVTAFGLSNEVCLPVLGLTLFLRRYVYGIKNHDYSYLRSVPVLLLATYLLDIDQLSLINSLFKQSII